MYSVISSNISLFQSTLPVWGGTFRRFLLLFCFFDFNPPSPCGEGHVRCTLLPLASPYFNPPSPCGEGHSFFVPPSVFFVFQSTLPVWGGTLKRGDRVELIPGFQSTLPVWGGTQPSPPLNMSTNRFQSTLPVWGGTLIFRPSLCLFRISIHPPRVGRDPRRKKKQTSNSRFQSTLPVWGGTGFNSQRVG